MLSPSTAYVDLGSKRAGYHRAGVGHYWVADPEHKTLTVLLWTAAGYLIHLVGGPGDKLRAPPFDGVEIDVGELFGIEAPEGEATAGVEPGPATP